jgi:hypothetical protein
MIMSAIRARESEVTILARVFSDKLGQLPPEMAQYILDLDFNDSDKARMHDLIVRNQEDAITPAEKDELFAFTNAGSMLSILQSRARRALGVKLKKRTVS